MALHHRRAPEDQKMTRFEFETAELARFDRRLLADVGLIGEQEPHPSQLRRLPAKSSGLAILLNVVLNRLTVRGVSAPATR
jgi:hypothetical protein